MIKKQTLTLLFATLLLFIYGCKKKEMHIKITVQKELTGIASASGIEVIGNSIYVIGDNSPFLFRLNRKMEIQEKINLFPSNNMGDSIIEKMQKPDLEALTLSEEENLKLYAFGSGSKSPERDILIELIPGKPHLVNKYDLTGFYNNLRLQANLSPEKLNIEAAGIFNGKLYLFNRGENLIIRYSMEDFRSFLEGKMEVPVAEIFQINLPAINGIPAGFSGATFNRGNESILFTATVEDTSNWIDDGEVLGSFLGIIPLKDLKNGLQPQNVVIGENAVHYPLKVESVAVIPPYTESKANIILVSDSDGGISEFLEAEVFF
ncbi:hypothetical protein FK178_07150 [Antarcticibacterium arcticum]|uniref:DUF4221 domain-containing protein n=1 Tax=Antarcticibacterium arcticum TaxID=2585771 RepID=A0A5B8YHU8_9FLAO|nr:hypothetical protein [Antarcticibacterium arcticum]QED37512.1 hypothetical protein FK178_07150 [Antarcticibacterium arcticum]